MRGRRGSRQAGEEREEEVGKDGGREGRRRGGGGEGGGEGRGGKVEGREGRRERRGRRGEEEGEGRELLSWLSRLFLMLRCLAESVWLASIYAEPVGGGVSGRRMFSNPLSRHGARSLPQRTKSRAV